MLAPFRPYLLQRWNEGIRNGTQLWREVVSLGYHSSQRSVQRFVGQLRRETGQPAFKFRQVAPAPLYDVGEAETTLPTLTALRAARLVLSKEEGRTSKERSLLERLRQADPAIERASHLTSAFCQILRMRQGAQVEAWIAQAQDSAIPELRAFAKSLLKDYQAVKAGLTLEWSNDHVAYCTSSLRSRSR